MYRIGREFGSLAARQGGLDALVFTAGVGEHASEMRRSVSENAAWLGIEFDHAANERDSLSFSRPGSRASAWVIPTDEDLMIARHIYSLITTHGGGRFHAAATERPKGDRHER